MKTLLLSLVISGILSGFFGVLFYAGMPDDFVKGGFHIVISILAFCVFLIGIYIIVEENRLLKKTNEDIRSVISGNAIWIIVSIAIWIFALVFLPVLIYTSHWAITGEITHSIPYHDEYSG